MLLQSATLTARVLSQATRTVGLLTMTEPVDAAAEATLTDGSLANQANQTYQARRTLAPAAGETLALRGVLADSFGDTVTLARVKALLVRNTSATGSLTLGGAASNPWLGPLGGAAHTLTLRPGGFLFLAAPDATAYPVTPGSADQLKLTNNDATNPLTYELVIVGATS